MKLVVTLPAPTNLIARATNLLVNLSWNSVSGAGNYNLKRGTTNNGSYPTIFSGLTGTNYADAAVSNATQYFYVVSAIDVGGESPNSSRASAIPLPSDVPANLAVQVSGDQLLLSWPQDHLGWRLQVQTNDFGGGLGTNWITVPNSSNVMMTNISVDPAIGSEFFRLIYP